MMGRVTVPGMNTVPGMKVLPPAAAAEVAAAVDGMTVFPTMLPPLAAPASVPVGYEAETSVHAVFSVQIRQAL